MSIVYKDCNYALYGHRWKRSVHCILGNTMLGPNFSCFVTIIHASFSFLSVEKRQKHIFSRFSLFNFAAIGQQYHGTLETVYLQNGGRKIFWRFFHLGYIWYEWIYFTWMGLYNITHSVLMMFFYRAKDTQITKAIRECTHPIWHWLTGMQSGTCIFWESCAISPGSWSQMHSNAFWSLP